MDIELDNGGAGGGNNNDAAVVSSFPNPADPRANKEPQPFTWLRAAPYIVAVLAGVALFAVGLARMDSRSCSEGATDANKAASNMTGCVDDLGFVLALVGAVLVVFYMMAMASTELSGECCAPRLDQTDD